MCGRGGEEEGEERGRGEREREREGDNTVSNYLQFCTISFSPHRKWHCHGTQSREVVIFGDQIPRWHKDMESGTVRSVKDPYTFFSLTTNC